MRTQAAIIRPATRNDLDRLVAIENASFDHDRISRRSFLRQMRSPTLALIVAELDEGVGGYALLAMRKDAHHARIYSLAVEGAEGRGVGRLLMAACDDLARDRGYASVRLEVKESNARAIGIYERAGFQRIDRKSDYYEDGETALVYEKALES